MSVVPQNGSWPLTPAKLAPLALSTVAQRPWQVWHPAAYYSIPTIILVPVSMWLRLGKAPYVQMRRTRGVPHGPYIEPHLELTMATRDYRRLMSRTHL